MKKRRGGMSFLWVNHKAAMFVVVLSCLIFAGSITFAAVTRPKVVKVQKVKITKVKVLSCVDNDNGIQVNILKNRLKKYISGCDVKKKSKFTYKCVSAKMYSLTTEACPKVTDGSKTTTTTTPQVTVVAKAPDLVVSNVLFDHLSTNKQAVVGTFTIKNIGTEVARAPIIADKPGSGGFRVTILTQRNDGTIVQTGSTGTDPRNEIELDPGEEKVFNFAVSFPGGVKKVAITVDWFNDGGFVTESDETNNQIVTVVPVEFLAQAPDLIVKEIKLNEGASSTDILVGEIVIQNVGSTVASGSPVDASSGAFAVQLFNTTGGLIKEIEGDVFTSRVQELSLAPEATLTIPFSVSGLNTHPYLLAKVDWYFGKSFIAEFDELDNELKYTLYATFLK